MNVYIRVENGNGFVLEKKLNVGLSSRFAGGFHKNTQNSNNVKML